MTATVSITGFSEVYVSAEKYEQAMQALRGLQVEHAKALKALEKKSENMTYLINRNNRLWLAMSKLPGGLEAARACGGAE